MIDLSAWYAKSSPKPEIPVSLAKETYFPLKGTAYCNNDRHLIGHDNNILISGGGLKCASCSSFDRVAYGVIESRQ